MPVPYLQRQQGVCKMEKVYKELGFSRFVHLEKEKRDGIERITWTGLYKDDLITILLKRVDENWTLEKILIDNYDSFLLDLIRKSDLNGVLDFIRSLIKT